MKNILVGSRYFDNKKVVYKVVKIKNKDTYSLINTETKERVTKTKDELDSKYTLLIPNGYVIVSIVETELPTKEKQKDVVVALYRNNQRGEEAEHNLPYCVCRQNIINVFYNIANPSLKKCGMCLSLESCPKDINYTLTLACDKIYNNIAIAVYMDDSLDDVLKLFKHDAYNTVLKPGIKNNVGQTYGYVGTLRELLDQEDFQYDMHRAFGIQDVDFGLIYDPENYLLDSEQTEFFKHEFNNDEIFDMYAIEFDYKIRLRDIKKEYYKVFSKQDKKLYLLPYTKGLQYDSNVVDVIRNIRSQSKIIKQK